jgi:hypothetical protein
VRGNRLSFINRSVVLISDRASHDGLPFYALTSGAGFDLATRKIPA